jgi:hypothetical protein
VPARSSAIFEDECVGGGFAGLLNRCGWKGLLTTTIGEVNQSRATLLEQRRMKEISKACVILTCVVVVLVSCFSYQLPTNLSRSAPLQMSSLDLSARPTIEEWLDVCDPGLKRTTLSMFKACKEIAYKIRTASCNKMACFNDFGKTFCDSVVNQH